MIKATFTGHGELSPPLPTSEPARYIRLAPGKPTAVEEATAVAIVTNESLAGLFKVTDTKGKPWSLPERAGDKKQKEATK